MKTSAHEQYTPGWWADRAGMFSASMFGELITPGGEPTSSTKSGNAINLALASWLVGGELPSFQSYWMKRGTELEPEAREKLEWIANYKIDEIGFCIHDDGYFGASPDGVVSDCAMIVELKCPAPNTLVGYYLNGFPKDYKPQVQGQLLVTGMPSCHFAAYHPDMPLFEIIIDRDEAYIEKLYEQLQLAKFVLDERKKRLIDSGYAPA